MTNEQLAVLLRNYHRQLEAAYYEAADAMPENAARNVNKVYIGPPAPNAFLGTISATYINARNDPANWEERADGGFIALDPILNLLTALDTDIAKLTSEE